MRIVEPPGSLHPDFNMWGQQCALQVLVNILEKSQSLATLKLTPSQVFESQISFSESISQEIQQLGTKLLSHLLAHEHFQQDITTKKYSCTARSTHKNWNIEPSRQQSRHQRTSL